MSDSAAYYAEIIEHNYVSGEALTWSGALLAGLGLLAVRGWHDSDRKWLGVGASVMGLGMSMIGAHRVRRARNAMDSVIWWYNTTLADTSSFARSDPRVRALPVPVPAVQKSGRAGMILGSVAGLAAGLAVSSRHDSSEAAVGLCETVALTGLGALVGRAIGGV